MKHHDDGTQITVSDSPCRPYFPSFFDEFAMQIYNSSLFYGSVSVFAIEVYDSYGGANLTNDP
jgi:hypothetical protein